MGFPGLTPCGDEALIVPAAVLGGEAGAVYVARLEGSWRDASVLAKLRELERVGFGHRRHQGFGHAIFFDPFILTREQTS